jgi:thioredoxin-like negative regulator of GroEL
LTKKRKKKKEENKLMATASTPSGQVTAIRTSAEFTTHVLNVPRTTLVVVDAHPDWTGPCLAMRPTLRRLVRGLAAER